VRGRLVAVEERELLRRGTVRAEDADDEDGEAEPERVSNRAQE
jgi:hypothetical protein